MIFYLFKIKSRRRCHSYCFGYEWYFRRSSGERSARGGSDRLFGAEEQTSITEEEGAEAGVGEVVTGAEEAGKG